MNDLLETNLLQPKKKKKKNSNVERQAIFEELLMES